MLCLYDRGISLAQIGCNAQTTCKIEKTNMTKNRAKIVNAIPLAKGEQHHIPPAHDCALLTPFRPCPRRPVHTTALTCWEAPAILLSLVKRFKVQGLFIRHIINYTGYNQKWNVNQIRACSACPLVKSAADKRRLLYLFLCCHRCSVDLCVICLFYIDLL